MIPRARARTEAESVMSFYFFSFSSSFVCLYRFGYASRTLNDDSEISFPTLTTLIRCIETQLNYDEPPIRMRMLSARFIMLSPPLKVWVISINSASRLKLLVASLMMSRSTNPLLIMSFVTGQ